tara:strand:- start:33 stop:263 length:231 start_codon:yes stop_codon:yes gene_type:complete
MSTENSNQESKSNELYTLLGTVKFYRVTRPYCSPSSAYTFALNEEDARLKVAKKYGGVCDSKAREINEDEFNEFVS